MRKKLLLVLLFAGIVVTGGYSYLRFSLQKAVREEEKKTGRVVPDVDSLGGKKLSVADLRPLFIQRLQLLLKKSTQGLYDLAVADMNVDVLASTVSLHGVKMTPNATVKDSLQKTGGLPANLFTVTFDDFVIEGINLDDALTSKTMDYRLVKLVKPKIVVQRLGAVKTKAKHESENFTQNFLKEMEKLALKKIVIEEGEITVYNEGKNPTKLENISVEMKDVLIDSATRLEKDRFLFAKEATLSFRNFRKPTRDGLYLLKIGAVTVKAPQQTVSLSNLSFASPLNRSQFVKRQKQSKELFQLSLPSVHIGKADWWDLVNEKEFVADEIKTAGGKLSVFLDRSLPPRNKMGNFPSQLLSKLPVPINVARAIIHDLDFSYSEYNPVSQQTGTVVMDKVAMTITNLSNQKTKRANPLTVAASTLFMGSVPLEARFSFDLRRAVTGGFSASVKAKGFDASLLNSFTVPLGMIRIDKGVLESTETTMQGDEKKAAGDVLIKYRDLKLSLLEKEKGEAKLDKKDVTSLLANLLVIKNDNPKNGKEPRREKGEFIRQPEGGFFMLVWKTLLVGALKTIGAPTKLAYKKPAAADKKQ